MASSLAYLFKVIWRLEHAQDDRLHSVAADLVKLHDELALLYNGGGEYPEGMPHVCRNDTTC